MTRRTPPTAPTAPIDFPRADPAELAKFDPTAKQCAMNCSRSAADPRTDAERIMLCGDCNTMDLNNTHLTSLLADAPAFRPDLLARITKYTDRAFQRYKDAERLVLDPRIKRTPLEQNTAISHCNALEFHYRVAANLRRKLTLQLEQVDHFLYAVEKVEDGCV